MNDRSIREDHPTEVELLLLRSVQLDAPPRSSKGRALAALGLAAATTAAAGTGGAATAGAVAGLAKWIAVVAVAGIAVGAARTLSPHATTTAPLPVVREPQRVNHEVLAPSPLPVRQVEREPPALAEPASSAPATTVVPRRALPAARSAPNPLAAEVASLEGVRNALAAHDPKAAGQLLDRHEARFREPSLGPEAALLRVEVLVAVGDVQGARRIGSRLLAEQPDSAYGQRVRSLLEEASPPSAP
jgi:hypothetical protein